MLIRGRRVRYRAKSLCRRYRQPFYNQNLLFGNINRLQFSYEETWPMCFEYLYFLLRCSLCRWLFCLLCKSPRYFRLDELFYLLES